MCLISHVMCHMSHVTWLFLLSNWCSYSVEGPLSMRPAPSSFSRSFLGTPTEQHHFTFCNFQTKFHISEEWKKLKMEQVVFKHFQKGFCKCAEHCRKHHVQKCCQTHQCKYKACIQWYPTIWRYFTTHNTCKLGEKCAYQHKNSEEKSGINELVAKLGVLENTIQVMS